MFSHADIWKAIDLLAARHGLSPSGLALKAGLSSTLFNPSKRVTARRPRWPSTESIAAILDATQTPLDEFVALIAPDNAQTVEIPLISTKDAPEALPDFDTMDRTPLPGSSDPLSFMIEIADKSFEPAYREGTRLLASPAEKPRRGDHVVARLSDGELTIKILGREGAQKVELFSLRSDQPPVTLTRADVAWLYRIIWVSR